MITIKKVMYDMDGFIYRPDQDELIKKLGMPRAEFIRMMQDGFVQEKMPASFPEVRTLVRWFEDNNYILMDDEESHPVIDVFPVEEYKGRPSDAVMVHMLPYKNFRFKNLEWYDPKTGYAMGVMIGDKAEELKQYFKINE